MKTTLEPLGSLWLALTGPLVWLAHIVALYATEALLCAGPASGFRLFFPIATVLTVVAGLALVGFVSWRKAAGPGGGRLAGQSGSRFLHDVSIPLSALALLGVIWATLPAMLLPACAPVVGN